MGFLSAAPTDPEAQYQQNIVALERRIADLERAGGRLSSSYMSALVPWINVAGGIGFANSWVNFGGAEQVARYRKIGDMVYIEGLIKSGTAAAAFTLPAGFRPPLNVYFSTIANDAYGGFYITAAGAVTVRNGSNAYFSVNCSFSTV